MYTEFPNDLIKNDKYTYNGISVPRVTDVISSMIYEESLLRWANHLGFNRLHYNKVRDEAANLGSKTHERIEAIVNGASYRYEDEIIPVQSFLKWYEIVKNNTKFEVIYTEKTLVCPLFGGTLDCLAKINNAIYLIDYKTSSIVTYKYFLQLAAYRQMLRELEGIVVDGVIVLHLDKKEPSFEEYVMNLPQYQQVLDHYEMTFNALVQAYINILVCKQDYQKFLQERMKNNDSY